MRAWRRGLAALALAAAGLFAWGQPAHAAPPPVVDDARLLTSAEEESLTARVESIQAQHGFDVAIYTTSSPGSKSRQDANEDHYERSGYAADGTSFFLAIDTRDWDIWFTPGRGQQVFTNYGQGVIGSMVLPYLSDGDYAGAFELYLDLVDEFLAQAAAGEPYDSDNPYNDVPDYGGGETYYPDGGGSNSGGYTTTPPWRFEHPVRDSLAIGGVVGLLVAAIVLWKWKRALKTARPARAANAYEKPGSLQITVRTDQKVSSHTTSTPIPRHESSSSGGGGGGGSFSVGGGHVGGKF
ncbi:MAG: TPM domain-containing protein [Propionibacteriaceae bacterium]|jgi:uncharacterized protein|nr:TPM domain-containing protein [Propionibacteriaceae bacterium]